MVDASSFSKRPCWLLSSLSSLCTGDSLNHSFSACLSFTHSLSGMNHIPVASPLLPATLQRAEPAHRSAPDSVMWAILPPQRMWAATRGVCTAWHWLGGHSWALGLHSTSTSPKQWEVINLQELPQYLLKSLFPSHAVSPYLWNDPTTPFSSWNMVLSQSF